MDSYQIGFLISICVLGAVAIAALVLALLKHFESNSTVTNNTVNTGDLTANSATIGDLRAQEATIGGLSYPESDGQDGDVLTTNGNGVLTLAKLPDEPTSAELNESKFNAQANDAAPNPYSGIANTFIFETGLTFQADQLKKVGDYVAYESYFQYTNANGPQVRVYLYKNSVNLLTGPDYFAQEPFGSSVANAEANGVCRVVMGRLDGTRVRVTLSLMQTGSPLQPFNSVATSKIVTVSAFNEDLIKIEPVLFTVHGLNGAQVYQTLQVINT